MIDFSKIECVGCTACVSICPKDVLHMAYNEEGFQYPIDYNSALCIECGLCESVCPVIHTQQEKKGIDIAYIGQNTDEEIRRESASGGMFSAIAISVLNNKGIVYGAAYDQDFEVKHIAIRDERDLWKLRNSKYVQSNLNGIFKDVENNLKTGVQVCFSGTPCQIEGLKFYLRRDYANLLLVDVVCHGVSSPLIWKKYIETIQKYSPKRIYFRWKHYGYKYSTMSIFDDLNNEVYFAGVESDKMLRAYFSNNCDRETCYNCKFKKRYRVSDITIWDCFQPRFYNKSFDDDLGTSCILINTEKGKEQFDKIVQNNLLRCYCVVADELTKGNNEMIASVRRGDLRSKILVDASRMSADQFFEQYFPDSVAQKIKRTLRLFLIKTGFYAFVKYIIYAVRRKRGKK